MCIFARFTRCRALGLCFALAWLVPSEGWAQSKPVKGVGLGLAAGATTGIGLSARLRLPQGFGVTMAGMPYFDADNRIGSLGVQGTWDLLSTRGLSIYALFGTQLFIHRLYYRHAFRQDKVRRRYDTLVVGPGVGVELRNGRFGFNLDVALASVIALRSSTYLRYPGRVNVGVFPNVLFFIYLGSEANLRR